MIKSLEQIFVEGQYGSSFRYVHRDGDAIVDASSFVGVSGRSKLRGRLLEETTYFVKCPDERLDPRQQREFVEREFDNGASINHVADRLETRPVSEDSFSVSRMIGHGSLKTGSAAARPCLIYEYAGSPSVTNHTLAKTWKVPYRGSSLGFLGFAERFARAVQVLHNQGIVHSFIVPRNIVCSTDEPSLSSLKGSFMLVGFGYARQTDGAGRRSGVLGEGLFRVSSKDNWFRAPECRETSSHATPGYSSDIYSIGAVLFSLLIEDGHAAMDVLRVPPADNRRLRRMIYGHFFSPNQSTPAARVIRENENILKIIDSCLRVDPDERYSCVEELLEAIQIARKADQGSPLSSQPTETSHDPARLLGLDAFERHLAQVKVRTSPALRATSNSQERYFSDLGSSLAQEVGRRFAGLDHGHFEVYGHRDRIISSLCRLLASARTGDLYRTMTLPDYWTDRNLGSFGRFLTMNRHMARRGLRIERLFLVSQDFHSMSEEEQTVLEDQFRAVNDLVEEMHRNGSASHYVVKVLEVSEDKIADFETNGELVAYLEESEGTPRPASKPSVNQPKHPPTICLNFFSTARDEWQNGKVSVKRTIKKARYWSPSRLDRDERFAKSKKKFQSFFDTAKMLEDFIYPDGQPKAPSGMVLTELVGSRRR